MAYPDAPAEGEATSYTDGDGLLWLWHGELGWMPLTQPFDHTAPPPSAGGPPTEDAPA